MWIFVFFFFFLQKFSSTVLEQMFLEYFLFLGGRETYYGGEQCVLKLIIMVRGIWEADKLSTECEPCYSFATVSSPPKPPYCPTPSHQPWGGEGKEQVRFEMKKHSLSAVRGKYFTSYKSIQNNHETEDTYHSVQVRKIWDPSQPITSQPPWAGKSFLEWGISLFRVVVLFDLSWKSQKRKNSFAGAK